MSRLLPVLASGLLVTLSCLAPARAGTVWLCGLSDDLTRIVCIADTPAAEEPMPAAAPAAQVNGTRFPLDTRRQWTVDLWSPATEAEPVTLLARATLCWRTPDCAVVMNTAVLEPRAVSRRLQPRVDPAGR